MFNPSPPTPLLPELLQVKAASASPPRGGKGDERSLLPRALTFLCLQMFLNAWQSWGDHLCGDVEAVSHLDCARQDLQPALRAWDVLGDTWVTKTPSGKLIVLPHPSALHQKYIMRVGHDDLGSFSMTRCPHQFSSQNQQIRTDFFKRCFLLSQHCYKRNILCYICFSTQQEMAAAAWGPRSVGLNHHPPFAHTLRKWNLNKN